MMLYNTKKYNRLVVSIIKDYLKRLSIFIVPLVCSQAMATHLMTQTDSLNTKNKQSKIDFQDAAQFTHLKWQNTLSTLVSVNLLPINNYSGIPMEERDEKAEYYYHGKLPTIMQAIYVDAFRASRFFNPDTSNADYQVEMIIDHYKLPFKYAPDDQWWVKLHDQTDRWGQSPPPTHIKLTIKVKSGLKKIKTWMQSTEMKLSNCDLNRFPQPATTINNRNETIRVYLSTTPGQTFLAATNYLILKTIERLNQEASIGRVTKTFGQEIYLTSENTNFIEGSQVNIYYNHPQNGKLNQPAGKLKILKAMQNQAVAYPMTLRADHITVGDWVEIGNQNLFEQPVFYYKPVNQCGLVQTAQLN